MKSIMHRASKTPLILLLLFTILTTFTPEFAASAESTYNLIVAINGSSFLWSILKDKADKLVTPAFQMDLGSAGGSDVTITVSKIDVNATALFVFYIAVTSSESSDEISKRVYSNTLNNVNSAIETASKLSEIQPYADIIPKNVRPFTPLFPPPNNTTNSNSTNIETLTANQVILLNGGFNEWQSILQKNQDKLTSLIEKSVSEAVAHADVTANCTVNNFYVEPADPEKKSMGNGESGLMITVTVNQNKTAKTIHVYDSLELSGLLMTIDLKEVNNLYHETANKNTTKIVVVTVRDYNEPEWKCNSLCKGMIGMGAAIFVLIFLAYFITICAVCCPCGVLEKYTRRFHADIYSDREPSSDEYKYDERPRREHRRDQSERQYSKRSYEEREDYAYDDRKEYSRKHHSKRYGDGRRPY